MGLYKTLIKRWILDDSDEIEIRLHLLYCFNILEDIWLIQTFNSQILRDDL